MRRTAAGAAAASVLPARLAATDGVSVLSIGVGGRGSSDALAAARLGRVVACCDVDSAQIDAFLIKLAKQQPSPPDRYKDYRKELERKDIDVVTIGTPDHWHTRRAFMSSAGKSRTTRKVSINSSLESLRTACSKRP